MPDQTSDGKGDEGAIVVKIRKSVGTVVKKSVMVRNRKASGDRECTEVVARAKVREKKGAVAKLTASLTFAYLRHYSHALPSSHADTSSLSLAASPPHPRLS